ncbi:oligosaccharyl transferase subunit (alpha), putative [Talaromyces stipitatus ATCC 10500]|uniref:Dolichyl-diphosphooligosaccharide--protein glycosyltransferase subunit 1 n=1 Tax=Talaromyces stipitatus (strain ATCC 10500 / CBS 375.48 / QM 6759 / NRRL 1006) TaxID=441959 RepID=B8LT42_TALSN|nr:oligosaccharyl transferase subunit (alpha), putative [Talaromyces stipitatus ATCC 10500]EED23550.1 oligosaccharyl transferase subunit (alpha), putative [Talaromyces stipitatus ATCC 10500]
MRFLSIAAALLSTSCSTLLCAAEPVKDFTPPEVFKNVNLVRNTNLEKGYARETINVVVENTDKQPQSDYYVPFPSDVFSRIGGFEVRNKKSPEKGSFPVTAVEADGGSTQFYKIQFPEPLSPSSQTTLSISYYVLGSFSPLPKSIGQSDSQYLTYTIDAYAPSAYKVETQKTKVKFPTSNVPGYTITSKLKTGNDPEKQGSTFTYGPYTKVAPGATYPLTFRFESTKPILASSLLQRDIEVSHWGGNLAIEERYWLRNDGANLSRNFDRVEWARQSYGVSSNSALQELKYPLKPGSVDPYFTDDVGNVSTSRYRPGNPGREAHLELKPRFPVFGGWKYSFRVGWNNHLSSFLRKVGAESYVLKVPFIEGPKAAEGIQYDKVVVRVILPEGATDIKYEILDSGVPNGLPDASYIESSISKHRTYMDTIGRTALTLKVDNLSDEARDSQLLVTYTYPFTAGLRKPLTIAAGLLSIFVGAWFIGSLDVSIKKR